MPEHKVKKGDCLLSIAAQYGISWEKIWNHPKNTKLRQQRQDPNILYPGDIVFVPDKEIKELEAATEQKYQFRKKEATAKLRIRILEETTAERQEQTIPPPSLSPNQKDSVTEDPQGEEVPQRVQPRSNVPYIAEFDGFMIKGTTDDEGMVEINIKPHWEKGRLILEPGTIRELILSINLGHLDPITELSGVKQRLINLGFDCGDTSAEETPRLEEALRAFQKKYGLPISGQADQQTRDKLKEVHGS